MIKKENNYAYIDGANLHKAVQELGWELDYKRLYVWLSEKYAVTKAYFFIGLIPKYKSLYTYLQECGFTLVFKETIYDADGKTKGNCDAELVLNAVRDYYEVKFDKVVLVTGDGDFACLANFLKENSKLGFIVAPDSKKCSYLLRRIQVPVVYLNGLQKKLGLKRKSPQ
jgi:uncharacterized LabA/DUF88 family protein